MSGLSSSQIHAGRIVRIDILFPQLDTGKSVVHQVNVTVKKGNATYSQHRFPMTEEGVEEMNEWLVETTQQAHRGFASQAAATRDETLDAAARLHEIGRS